MKKLSEQEIKNLSHPYYTKGFKEDSVSITDLLIDKNKLIATLQVNKLFFDKKSQQTHFTALLMTRWMMQLAAIYYAWEFNCRARFIARRLTVDFKKFIIQRSFSVILEVKCRRNLKYGGNLFKVFFDFDDTKALASMVALSLPRVLNENRE